MCAQSLPFGQTVAKSPVYFLQMIWDMAEYANHLIRLSNKGNISPSYTPGEKMIQAISSSKRTHHFLFLPLCPGLVLGSKAQTGIVQYEAVELLFCLSFLLVLSQHRPLYRDLLPHLHKRMHPLEALTHTQQYHTGTILWQHDMTRHGYCHEHEVICSIRVKTMFGGSRC